MRHAHRWILSASLTVLIVLTGCAAARLQNAWSNPAVGPLRSDDTFLAVVIADSPSLRRAAEDELVRRLGAGRATASYTLLGDDPGNEELAKARLREAGVDYAVVLRPLGTREETDWVPGQLRTYPVAYRSFWGYYRVGWSAFETPGYLRTDLVVAVETLVYSIAEDEVVWAAEAELTSPTSAQRAVRDITTASIKDLRRRGLLPTR